MLKRLRGHLSPPMVVSMIALFAALGGGYAVAFSGSGSVQKENEIGIPAFPDDETLRTLTGIGSIQVSCQVPTEAVIRFVNGSGENLDLYKNESGVVSNIPSGELQEDVASDGGETFRYHVSPSDGSKRPQAEVIVSATNGSTCGNTRVSVLVLNTEE